MRALCVRRQQAIWASALLLTVFTASFTVYLLTLAPSITWRHDGADSGDFVTAALTGGVPHPPGSPTYVILAELFARLPLREPARGVNLLSALSAATACAGAALAIFLLMRGAATDHARHPLAIHALAAGTAGLALAYSPTLWSQAIIAEVYALSAAFAAALLLALIVSSLRPAASLIRLAVWGAGLLLGLGAGSHLSVLLFLPSLILGLRRWAWIADRRVFTWLGAFGSLAIGLAIYLILPLRARSGSPVNWGDPATIDQFVWLVTGRLYGRYLFAYPLAMVPARLASWIILLRQQFGLWGIAVGLAGCWYLSVRRRGLLIVLALAYMPFVAYAVCYGTTDSYVYLIPSYVVFVLWIGYGINALWNEAQAWRRSRLWTAGLLAGCAMLVLTPLRSHWGALDLSADHEAKEYAMAALETAPPDALLLIDEDGPTFALWYAHYGLDIRPDLTIINVDLWSYDWYRDDMASRRPTAVLAKGASDPPADVASLIDVNRGGRAICASHTDVLPPQPKRWLPTGPIWCLDLPTVSDD